MRRQLILITGGARSGKSSFAERLALGGGRVLFVATAEPFDEDMKRRIDAHRLNRPSEWCTLEEPLDLASALQTITHDFDTYLVDCLTVWVSNVLLKLETCSDAEDQIMAALDGLMEVYERSSATWIVVSNEVGLGVVPPSPLGRRYRDVLGRVNQAVAARADSVYLMTAGLALELKSLGARQRTNVEGWDC